MGQRGHRVRWEAVHPVSVQPNRPFVAVAPITLGWIIAVLVLVIAIVLMVIGMLDFKLGLLVVGLAVARLV